MPAEIAGTQGTNFLAKGDHVAVGEDVRRKLFDCLLTAPVQILACFLNGHPIL